MADTQEYDIVTLNQDNFNEVADFLDNEFFPREPISLGFHVDNAQVKEGMFGEGLVRSLASGVSLGARHRPSGKLAGVRITEIKTPSDPEPTSAPIGQQVKVFKLLQKSMEGVDEFEGATRLLYMVLVCVHRDHERKGLGRRLVEATMKEGVSRGCQRAITTITSRFSGSIFLKLGYTTVQTLDLTTLGPEWNLDLAAMNGNSTIKIMTKQLP